MSGVRGVAFYRRSEGWVVRVVTVTEGVGGGEMRRVEVTRAARIDL